MGITRREFASLALGSAAGFAMSEGHAAEVFPGTTDCHVHIIGPADKYPMVPNRTYTPPAATVAQLKAMHARLGISRTVLVQPSFYGTDNSCMLDALAQLGNTRAPSRWWRRTCRTRPCTIWTPRAYGACGINLETGGNRDPKAAACAARGLCQEGGAAQLAHPDLHGVVRDRPIGAGPSRI